MFTIKIVCIAELTKLLYQRRIQPGNLSYRNNTDAYIAIYKQYNGYHAPQKATDSPEKID